MTTTAHGSLFEFKNNSASTKGQLRLGTFVASADYFSSSWKQSMSNFHEDSLEVCAEMLKEKGVTILDTLESYNCGKLLHIEDPAGNRITLWEGACGW